MFTFWLFLHVTGLTIWIGGLITFIFILSMLKRHLGSKEVSLIFKKIVRISYILLHPSAILAGISGFAMMITTNAPNTSQPFHLQWMEQIGSITIILSIIAISFGGQHLINNLQTLEQKGSVIKNLRSLNIYIAILISSLLLIASIGIIVIFHT